MIINYIIFSWLKHHQQEQLHRRGMTLHRSIMTRGRKRKNCSCLLQSLHHLQGLFWDSHGVLQTRPLGTRSWGSSPEMSWLKRPWRGIGLSYVFRKPIPVQCGVPKPTGERTWFVFLPCSSSLEFVALSWLSSIRGNFQGMRLYGLLHSSGVAVWFWESCFLAPCLSFLIHKPEFIIIAFIKCLWSICIVYYKHPL